MTKVRDRYQSSFDGEVPGVRAAVYDVGVALYLVERLARERGLLNEVIDLGRFGSYSLVEVLAIGNAALNKSIEPVTSVYERLRQNDADLRVVRRADPSAYEIPWLLNPQYVLVETLENRAVVTRSEMASARRVLASRAATARGGDAA